MKKQEALARSIEPPQAIELAPLDVEAAQQALATAQHEREKAEQSVEQAKTELARVKAAFQADPTPEFDERVEYCERAVRTAERFSDALISRQTAAETVLADAVRAAARRDVIRAGERREQLRRQLRERFTALRELHARTEQEIAIIEAAVSDDACAVEQANVAARAAGLDGTARPIDLDSVRQAFRLLITGGRPQKTHALTATGAASMDRVLVELSDERLTADERAAVVALAHGEAVRCTHAEAGDWLTPLHSVPRFVSHLPIAGRHQLAQALLAAILQNGETK